MFSWWVFVLSQKAAWMPFEDWLQCKASHSASLESLPYEFLSTAESSSPTVIFGSGLLVDCFVLLSLCFPLLRALWSSWKDQTRCLDQSWKICIWHSEETLCGSWWGKKKKCVYWMNSTHTYVTKTCTAVMYFSILHLHLFAECPILGCCMQVKPQNRCSWNPLFNSCYGASLFTRTFRASLEFFFKPFGV